MMVTTSLVESTAGATFTPEVINNWTHAHK